MQARNHQQPAIDPKNPCYCPGISAASYLKNLRHKLSNRKSRRPNHLFQAFAKVLEQSFLDFSDAESSNNSEDDWFIGLNLKARRPDYVSGSGSSKPGALRVDVLPPYSAQPPGHEDITGPSFSTDLVKLQSTDLQDSTKRKRTSFSDLQGPPKYSKSTTTAHDSSFDIAMRREVLRFDVNSSPNTLVNRTVEHVQCREKLDSFIDLIGTILPGIRLKERLSKISDLTVQKATDFLAHHGHINVRVLEVLQTSDVQSISLSASLSDEDGLNLCGQDLLRAFGKQESFIFLTELSFSGSRVQDFDLVHVHHLPKLSTLYLNNTGIANEAVYLLVPLKRTLTKLSLATNPDIDSQCVPAMLLLYKLSFLSVLDTSVDMVGLRTLAQTIFTEDRVMDIEIPFACETYIDNIDSVYFVNPVPPLIANPEVCSHLSTAALKRNLAAHAEKNPTIVASGTHAEMVERLSAILKMRKSDLLVLEMLGNGLAG